MSQPSVLLVSYHFYPSNEIGARRPTALARFLVEKGVRVVVVSAFGEQAIESGAEVLPGIIAVPVARPARKFIDAMVFLKRKIYAPKPAAAGPDTPRAVRQARASSSPWGRIRDLYFRILYFIDPYKSWGRHARTAALREGKRHPPSLVFSSSPPATVLWVGTLVSKRLGVPHVVDLRDPWTDINSAPLPYPPPDLALARIIEGWVMRSAAAITSTGATVTRLLIQRQPELAAKTFVVRNGYDGAVCHATVETGGRLTILFAGELYLNRDPFPLLHALERLLSRPDIDPSRVSMIFMGRTELPRRSFTDWLEGKRCAGVVEFVPPQPPQVVAEASLRSTVLLNLAQHQPLSVPAKTFEHLASGRENLLLCEDDSESAQLVAMIPGVIQVDPRDDAAMDRVLLDLYRRHVDEGRLRAPAEQDISPFSRASANEAFWRIMKSIATVEASNYRKNHRVEFTAQE